MKRTIIPALGLVILACVLFWSWLYPRYTVPILTYHDFGNAGIQVTPENFRKQMAFLKEKHYNVISLGELVEGVRAAKKFPRNSVVITFDDGYKDNYTIAYPVLKSLKFPATIFLISDNIGKDSNLMDWEQVRQMSKGGISFGGHTRHHVYIPSIKDDNVLWDETAGCKQVIEKNLGVAVEYFSYPKGGFTRQAQDMLIKAGYKGACATNRGSDPLNRSDMYELIRISIRDCDPYLSISNLFGAISFRSKLSGYYNIFRRKKSGG